MKLIDFFKELVRPIPSIEDIEKKQGEIAYKVYKEMKPRYSKQPTKDINLLEHKASDTAEHTM